MPRSIKNSLKPHTLYTMKGVPCLLDATVIVSLHFHSDVLEWSSCFFLQFPFSASVNPLASAQRSTSAFNFCDCSQGEDCQDGDQKDKRLHHLGERLVRSFSLSIRLGWNQKAFWWLPELSTNLCAVCSCISVVFLFLVIDSSCPCYKCGRCVETHLRLMREMTNTTKITTETSTITFLDTVQLFCLHTMKFKAKAPK